MSDFYIGQILFLAGPNVPAGFMPCDGRTLTVSQYQALFALIGNTYGGDGRTTFNLPDLRGRTPLGAGVSPITATPYNLGQKGGEEQVTLTQAQVPPHAHTLAGSSDAGTKPYPGNIISSAGSASGGAFYNVFVTEGSKQVALSGDNIDQVGGGAAHNNMQPYLTLNPVIVVNGIWPPRP